MLRFKQQLLGVRNSMIRLLKNRIFIAFVGSSVIASFFSITITRGCFRSYEHDGLGRLVCGNLAKSVSSFRRLLPENVVVTSNILESKEYSIDPGRGADKLVDGSLNTAAAPGSTQIDYTIDLLGPYQIKRVVLHWKDYGIDGKFIRNWTLEMSQGGGGWEIIASGGSPKTSSTTIEEVFNASAVRLTAESGENWIGVYEVELFGRPL